MTTRRPTSRAAPPPPARERKTLQHQRLPPDVLEALDTEAWFRERIREHGVPPARASKPSKEALFDEAIGWFVREYSPSRAMEWLRPTLQWPKVTFWVSDALLETCEALAREARVKRSRVLAQALRDYCARHVPPELVAFRRDAFERARALYRELHRPAPRARKNRAR